MAYILGVLDRSCEDKVSTEKYINYSVSLSPTDVEFGAIHGHPGGGHG